MLLRPSALTSLLVLLLPFEAQAASQCSYKSSTHASPPSVADGWTSNLMTDGLSNPRSILFDSEGHLLVVESGSGIRALTLSEKDGCVSVAGSKLLISDSTLNHGIELSGQGNSLFASSSDAVFRWTYDPKTLTVGSSKETLVTNMTNTDHTTRTLLLSKKKPGTLLVTRGSSDNIDPAAGVKKSSHSQIKAFDLNKKPTKPYDFYSEGKTIGWGLRNDVGLAEEPVHGGLYSVENSVDQISRYGTDFHENNPGEEMNYFGTLVNNKSPNQGANFGYPFCFAAWKVDEIPKHRGITVGSQFAINPGQGKQSDAWCREKHVAPRLTFQAHMAPLDIKFDKDGSNGWVTFHGSWDRSDPVGYAVAKIEFKNGDPVEKSTSHKGAQFIAQNPDNSVCPGQCFRPVGLALDQKGRIYFSSDQTGEIYMIQSA